MHLRKISRERVRDVGLCKWLFWVRRVWRRVNISLSDSKTDRHPCEILSPYSFDGIREALRTTENFPLCWPIFSSCAALALKEIRQAA